MRFDPDALQQLRDRLARRDRGVGRVEGGRRAAVAAVLRPEADDLHVLLIRRAVHPRDPWSGQMAFPGGRMEHDDESVLHTAQRETREEVGLDLARSGDLLGELDELPAVARGRTTGLVISPLVFVLREPAPLVLNSEVDEVLWAPLGAMGRGELDTTYPYLHEGAAYPMPAYNVTGRVVWGLTYRMLRMLLEHFEGPWPGRGPEGS